MVAQTGGGLASTTVPKARLPVLPDAFDSFGHFEFIETIESADGGVTSSGSDSALGVEEQLTTMRENQPFKANTQKAQV